MVLVIAVFLLDYYSVMYAKVLRVAQLSYYLLVKVENIDEECPIFGHSGHCKEI